MDAVPYEFPEFSSESEPERYADLSSALWELADEMAEQAMREEGNFSAYQDWKAIRQSLTWEAVPGVEAVD